MMVATATSYALFAVGVVALLSDPWEVLSSPFTGLRLVLLLPVLGPLLAVGGAVMWIQGVRRDEAGGSGPPGPDRPDGA
jgi:hypothetical protein